MREFRIENQQLRGKLKDAEQTSKTLQAQLMETVPAALEKIQDLARKLIEEKDQNEILKKQVQELSKK